MMLMLLKCDEYTNRQNRNQKILCYGWRGVNCELPFSRNYSEADPRDFWQAQWHKLDENCQIIRRRCHQRSEQRRRAFVSYSAYRFIGSLLIFVHNHVSRFQTTNISADIVSLQARASFIIIDTGSRNSFPLLSRSQREIWLIQPLKRSVSAKEHCRRRVKFNI